MIVHVDRTVSAHGNIYNGIHALLEDIKQAFANEDSLSFYKGQLKKAMINISIQNYVQSIR